MWTVLLVEDEVFVRETIRESLNWEAEGFRVIGEAGDGREALAMIREHRPDIVICDIMMPKMDGVQLLKKVREEKNDHCRFIMLTCMSDFENARACLEYGASNYILKLSMNVSSLKESLAKARKELEAVRYRKEPDWKQFYAACWDVYTQRINGDAKPFPALPLSLQSKEGCRTVTLLSVLSGEKERRGEDGKVFIREREAVRLVHAHTADGITTYFYWSEKPVIVDSNKVSAHGLTGVASAPVLPENMVPEWERVLSALDTYWYTGTCGCYSPRRASVRKGEYRIPWEKERRLLYAVEHLKQHSIREQADAIWIEMENRCFPIVKVKQNVRSLLTTIEKILSCPLKEDEDWMDQAHGHQHFKQLFLQWIDACMQKQLRREERTDHPEINRAMDYIQQHYDQPITVKRLAKVVAMDENYLSMLFKKKTGKSLISYIHRVRIEHAKTLLTGDEVLSVSEIAETVGFSSDNYFIKIFKRYTALTPSQFRQSYRMNERAE